MSYNDYNNGRLGVGGNKSSPDYQQGHAEAERRREAERQRNMPAPSPAPVIGTPGLSYPTGGASGAQDVGPSYVETQTLRTMAKSGASLFAVACVVFMLYQGTWTWVSLAVYTALSAVAGAIAGAALYIALKLLVIALKVAGMLLAIGIGLHLFGVINLPAVLSRLSAYVGL
jgi:hypothetical protein